MVKNKGIQSVSREAYMYLHSLSLQVSVQKQQQQRPGSDGSGYCIVFLIYLVHAITPKSSFTTAYFKKIEQSSGHV